MNTAKKTEQTPQQKTQLLLKPYTAKELAGLYSISKPTFMKIINGFEKEIGKRNGNYYTPKQVNIIFQKLGFPFAKALKEEQQTVEQKIKILHTTIDFYVNATWNFAKSVLWEKISFSEEEITVSKRHIREFYTLIPAKKFTAVAPELFIQYCERILLAKVYVIPLLNKN